MGKFAKKRQMPLAWIFGLLVACNVLAVGVTLAGFVTSTGSSDLSGAASFNVSAGTTNSSTIIFADMYPGATQNWDFDITNESEVAVRIVVTVETTGNLPLTYSVGNLSIPIGKATEIYSFAPGADETVDFSLKASWSELNKDQQYLNEVDAVTVTISAEQVD